MSYHYNEATVSDHVVQTSLEVSRDVVFRFHAPNATVSFKQTDSAVIIKAENKLSTGLLTIRLYLTNMVIASLNTHVFENWKNKQKHSLKTVQIYKGSDLYDTLHGKVPALQILVASHKNSIRLAIWYMSQMRTTIH